MSEKRLEAIRRKRRKASRKMAGLRKKLNGLLEQEEALSVELGILCLVSIRMYWKGGGETIVRAFPIEPDDDKMGERVEEKVTSWLHEEGCGTHGYSVYWERVG